MQLQWSEVQILSPRPILDDMNILISNDDGYFSEGIQNLRKALVKKGHEVFMVAPDRDYSACGMSISVRSPLTVRKLGHNQYAVSGTPVDCIALALGGLISQPIDLVVSGINNGANLCDDVLYSGTVAAAMEARRLANPSIAISIPAAQPNYYSTASELAVELIDKIEDFPDKHEIALLNVNVPDVNIHDLKGFKATVIGRRHKPISHRETVSEKGVRQCWLGGVGSFVEEEFDEASLYDHQCIALGYASVSPVKAEWIHKPYVDSCQLWLNT